MGVGQRKQRSRGRLGSTEPSYQQQHPPPPRLHTTVLRGNGQWNSCNAPPYCLGAVGRATSAMQCHTAWGPWAMKLLSCTMSLPRGAR